MREVVAPASVSVRNLLETGLVSLDLEFPSLDVKRIVVRLLTRRRGQLLSPASFPIRHVPFLLKYICIREVI